MDERSEEGPLSPCPCVSKFYSVFFQSHPRGNVITKVNFLSIIKLPK